MSGNFFVFTMSTSRSHSLVSIASEMWTMPSTSPGRSAQRRAQLLDRADRPLDQRDIELLGPLPRHLDGFESGRIAGVVAHLGRA
jgi:hypothetical protein